MKLINFSRLCLLLFLFAMALPPCFAKVFYSKDEALELAFGQDASIETLSLFPSDDQLQQIEKLAKAKLDSKLFSFFVGKKQNSVIGYAAIESHTVRTQPETLLIVLDAAGNLTKVVTLAFHEPAEYQPPERWFSQLLNHKIEQLSFDQDIQAVAGATLSTRTAMNSARKVMALFEIMFKPATSKSGQ